jgi:8-oxo-dGTP pyrophosphatase MutT (NUDIX family)
MNDIHPYKTIASKVVYENPWIRVREDKIIRPDGTEGIYGVVESNDSVMIVVLNDKDEVYLVNAYRYPDRSWNWELPGGGGDGEDAVAASRRELVEETGIIAEDWTLLGNTQVCNGLMTERQNTYLARNLTMTDKKDPEDEAVVNGGRFFPLSEMRNMVREGKINDGQSIAGLYLAEQWLLGNKKPV